MYDYAVKTNQRQKIWYGHEGIHAVGNVPHNSEIRHTAGKDSHDVEQTVGVDNVCERAAVAAAGGGIIVVPKRAGSGMTFALAELSEKSKKERRLRFDG